MLSTPPETAMARESYFPRSKGPKRLLTREFRGTRPPTGAIKLGLGSATPGSGFLLSQPFLDDGWGLWKILL